MKESNSKQTTRNESRSTSTRASHVNNPEGINQYSDKKSGGNSSSHSTTTGSSTSKTHNSTSKNSATGSSTSRSSHVNNPEGINQYSDKKTTGKTSR